MTAIVSKCIRRQLQHAITQTSAAIMPHVVGDAEHGETYSCELANGENRNVADTRYRAIPCFGVSALYSCEMASCLGRHFSTGVSGCGVQVCKRRNLCTHLMNAACHQQVCHSAVSPMLVLCEAASQTVVGCLRRCHRMSS